MHPVAVVTDEGLDDFEARSGGCGDRFTAALEVGDDSVVFGFASQQPGHFVTVDVDADSRRHR
jgi:hypothetical protein